MICRQIEKIEIENNIAKIYSNDVQVKKLDENEYNWKYIKEFFNEKNLSVEIVKEQLKKETPVDILNKILDGKLVVG